jgi:uncharacterized repeat protein (TIGR01451 family)
VVVSDTLPEGLTHVSSSAPAGTTCNAVGREITCTTASLPNGASLAIGVAAAVDVSMQAGTVVNAASVEADTADPDLTDNLATVSSQVLNRADPSVTKTVVPTAVAGDSVTYTMVATNKGPSTATAVTLTDPLPAGTTHVGTTTTRGTCSLANATVTCSLGSIAPGPLPPSLSRPRSTPTSPTPP